MYHCHVYACCKIQTKKKEKEKEKQQENQTDESTKQSKVNNTSSQQNHIPSIKIIIQFIKR